MVDDANLQASLGEDRLLSDVALKLLLDALAPGENVRRALRRLRRACTLWGI
jgi:hypothetical protein